MRYSKLLFLFGCLLISCGNNAEKAEIAFWCFDQNGIPIQGAKLTALGQEFVTDHEGKCLLQTSIEESGQSVALQARREGYRFLGPTEIVLEKGKYRKVPVYFFRDYRIMFNTVLNKDGEERPLSDIPVYEGDSNLGFTDAEGRFVYSFDGEQRGTKVFKAVHKKPIEKTLHFTVDDYDHEVKFRFVSKKPARRRISKPPPPQKRTAVLRIYTGKVLHTISHPAVKGGDEEEHQRKIELPYTTDSIKIGVRGKEPALIPIRLERGGSYYLECNFTTRKAILKRGARMIKTFDF